MSTNTIIGSLYEPEAPAPTLNSKRGLNNEILHRPESAEGKVFKIRGADSAGQRSSANVLIRRRYAWRGYGASSLPAAQLSNRITLTATDHNVTIGTISVGLDGSNALEAEATFADEIDALRAAGHRLCEFTKLAVDTLAASRRVLASLFHVAYLLAHRIHNHDTLIIEVNPRHVAYYRRLLGCTVLGTARNNLKVEAPAVLLTLDMHYAREQIARHAGTTGTAGENQRTLYPLFFSALEEDGIIARLRREEWK